MAFTAQDVKTLREMTNVGMMDCKKALAEADGDIDKAVEWLREKGLAAAQKKAGRIAAEGMAYAYVCPECGVGSIVEVNAESDFVAKNDLFVEYVQNVAKVVAKEAGFVYVSNSVLSGGEGTPPANILLGERKSRISMLG